MNATETGSEKGGLGPTSGSARRSPDGSRRPRWFEEPRPLVFAIFGVVLTLAFARALVELVQYALDTELHSHVVLIPFVSAYLIYIRRRELPHRFASAPLPGSLCALLGLVGLGLLFWKGREVLGKNDALALTVSVYLCFLLAGAWLVLGREWMKVVAFPAFFLVFMIPLPDGVVALVEQGLVLASAEATTLFFSLSGIPFYRSGQVFELPGIVLEVARECSGIRSSWVLLITSVLASYMLLKSPWRRALLIALVLPLGILRNGFRILVIGWLCVHRGPHMIDSPVHKSGGPYFFVLSLIPLFLLLWWLRRGERKSPDPRGVDPAT